MVRLPSIFLVVATVAMAHSAKKVMLSSGFQMPLVGLGTGGSGSIKGEEVEKVVSLALDRGYRSFDTAYVYENEKNIGKALKKWMENGGKRQELFITSKLPYFANNPRGVEKYLKESLENLGLDYLDLYLIHAPVPVEIDETGTKGRKVDGKFLFEKSYDPEGVWKEMEKQVQDNRTKSIGLSNFNETMLDRIYKSAEIKPSNLQIEVHPYFQQKSLVEFCRHRNIVISSYAPLGGTSPPGKFPILRENPVVKEIAAKHNRSEAQVILRFNTQREIAVIPRSSNPDRLSSNMDVFDFDLSDDDNKKLENLELGEVGRVYDWRGYLPGLENTHYYPFQ